MLDVAKTGYYETEMCLEDFENVSWLKFILNPPPLSLRRLCTKRIDYHG